MIIDKDIVASDRTFGPARCPSLRVTMRGWVKGREANGWTRFPSSGLLDIRGLESAGGDGVHAGYVINVIPKDRARDTLELFGVEP